MKTKSIIAFCGPSGSGKSTAAEHLITNHGYIRLSFAAPLREMLRALLKVQGVPPYTVNQMLFGNLKEEPSPYLAGRSPRYAMQTLGTEWRDLIDVNLWTNIWKNSVTFVPKVVVDDLRFTHEADAIHEMGGTVVWLDRSGSTKSDAHISERDHLNIVPDSVIVNRGTIEDLHIALNELIQNSTIR